MVAQYVYKLASFNSPYIWIQGPNCEDLGFVVRRLYSDHQMQLGCGICFLYVLQDEPLM